MREHYINQLKEYLNKKLKYINNLFNILQEKLDRYIKEDYERELERIREKIKKS